MKNCNSCELGKKSERVFHYMNDKQNVNDQLLIKNSKINWRKYTALLLTAITVNYGVYIYLYKLQSYLSLTVFFNLLLIALYELIMLFKESLKERANV